MKRGHISLPVPDHITQMPNTPCIRLWIDVIFRGVPCFLCRGSKRRPGHLQDRGNSMQVLIASDKKIKVQFQGFLKVTLK